MWSAPRSRTYLEFDFERVVAPCEALVETSDGRVTDSADQKRMVIPLNIWVEDGREFLHGINRFLKAGDEFANDRFHLGGARGRNGNGNGVGCHGLLERSVEQFVGWNRFQMMNDIE